MQWLPLSQRTGKKPALTGPYEGVPSWLSQSLTQWTVNRFRYRTSLYEERDDTGRLNRAERRLRLELPMGSFDVRLKSLMEKALDDNDVFLDLLDFLLSDLDTNPYGNDVQFAEELAIYLDDAASAWRVVLRDDHFCLERRTSAESMAAAEVAISDGDRAGQLLASAWNAVYGRTPNPGLAYRDAVRAVEAAARPIITPADTAATLGKMVAALRDAPNKWDFALEPKGGHPVEMVETTMSLLWTAQLDRHGTDDAAVPLNVSAEEAAAGVQLAVTLVNWLRSGALKMKTD